MKKFRLLFHSIFHSILLTFGNNGKSSTGTFSFYSFLARGISENDTLSGFSQEILGFCVFSWSTFFSFYSLFSTSQWRNEKIIFFFFYYSILGSPERNEKINAKTVIFFHSILFSAASRRMKRKKVPNPTVHLLSIASYITLRA